MDAGGPSPEALAERLATGAAAVVRFGRDATDSFTIAIEARDPALAALTNRDVLPLLPAGTRWRQALGWSSVFGLPVALAGRDWVAVGVEWIDAHATRGAFPRLVAALHPAGVEGALAGLLAAAGRELAPATARVPEWTHGAVPLGDVGPAQLAGIHGEFLLRASDAYRRGVRLLVRSVLLAEEEIPPTDLLGPRAPFRHQSFLVGYVPALVEAFSPKARVQLFLYRNLRSSRTPG